MFRTKYVFERRTRTSGFTPPLNPRGPTRGSLTVGPLGPLVRFDQSSPPSFLLAERRRSSGERRRRTEAPRGVLMAGMEPPAQQPPGGPPWTGGYIPAIRTPRGASVHRRRSPEHRLRSARREEGAGDWSNLTSGPDGPTVSDPATTHAGFSGSVKPRVRFLLFENVLLPEPFSFSDFC